MFRTRLISGIVLIVIALAVILAGGPVLLVTLLAVSLIGMNELYRAVGMEKGEKAVVKKFPVRKPVSGSSEADEENFAGAERKNLPDPERRNRAAAEVKNSAWGPLSLAGYAGAFLYYLVVFAGSERFLLFAVLGALVLILAVYVFLWPRYESGQVMASFFGVVYVAVMLSFVYLTRMREDGRLLVWLIFLCSWGCDTCAYCVGMLIGKHKMSPKLSPKKSVEGAVGGVVGAAALGAIYAVLTGHFTGGTGSPAAEYALICAAGALLSMVGDLAASAIKRNHDIKDYGTLIPGHGGILDRFDSVILTAPLIWLLAEVLL